MSILLQANSLALSAVDSTNMVANMTLDQEEITLPIIDLAMQGGWIMLILALISAYAVYIFFSRLSAISRASKVDKNFMNNIRDMIHEGKIDAAIALCKAQDTPTSRMIEKGVRRIGKPLNDIGTTIENVGSLEVSTLEKDIPSLATISGIAPMIGFLGTVLGMIRAFYDMSMAGNNIDIHTLSSGIYQAMVTTVAGLIVGIVAYVFYNILVGRIDRLIFKLEANSTEFMDLLNEPAS